MIKYYCIGLLLLLTGCKSHIGFPIKLSDFDSKKESIRIQGFMSIEVSSCIDSKTKIPSDDVFKLQNKIPYIFKESVYSHCEDEGMRSFAWFSIPANIDNLRNSKPVDDQIINLSFFPRKANPENRNLVILLAPKLKESISNLIESSDFASLDDISMTFEINTGGKKLEFRVIGAYLEDTPVQYNTFSNKADTFNITIPPYGIKQMVTSLGKFSIISRVRVKKP